MAARARYTGVYPFVPTTFTEDGRLDLESQKRSVDFLIDAGSNWLDKAGALMGTTRESPYGRYRGEW